MSPHRYVVHLRLHRAIELVRDGRSGLAEIAARTGFADQSHLSCWVRRAVTSGLAGKRPHAGWALGARICSAMEGLIITRALAVELAPIRVNIVCPGVVKSPLWAAMTEPDRAALYRQTAGKLPVEIAEAYLYLMPRLTARVRWWSWMAALRWYEGGHIVSGLSSMPRDAKLTC